MASSPIAPAPMFSNAPEGLALLLGANVVNPQTLQPELMLGSTRQLEVSDVQDIEPLQPSQSFAVPQDSEYVLLCFSASYCKHCEVFMPKLKKVADSFLQPKGRTSVVLFVGDTEQEKFDAYIKAKGFPALPFAETKVKKSILRAAWGIRTIPHCVLLDRKSGAVLHANLRFAIEKIFELLEQSDEKQVDSAAEQFLRFATSGREGEHAQELLPADSVWQSGADHLTGLSGVDQAAKTTKLSLRDRFFFKKAFFQQGHTIKPGSKEEYVDEEVVRIRAGLLHALVWCIIIQHFFAGFGEDVNLIVIIFPLVVTDFLAASFIGLTPFAPIGVLATVIAHVLRLPTKWKPAKPKRFAWLLGVGFASTCFSGRVAMIPTVQRCAMFACLAATWLEAACGFCAGCFVWNYIIVPRLRLKPCEECKM